jgi:Leucine-rich repeat (LRR) protein
MADAEEKIVLKPGMCTAFLSNFERTVDSENFVFMDFNLQNRKVESLAKTMDECKEVRRCDLSLNNIVDVSMLKDMQQLIHVNLAKNKIKSLAVFCNDDMFPNLKWLDVSTNKISELPPFKLPKLEYLDISGNKLEKINEGWTGHPNVRVFKTVDNKFKSLSQFKAMPKLETLYMAQNVVTVLGGW